MSRMAGFEGKRGRNMLCVQRYKVRNETLLPFVKHIWHLEEKSADIHYQLLPTDHIDVLINLADSMYYEAEGRRLRAPSCHINGLRSNYSYIHQTGTASVYGITFYAYGLYPFIRRPLDLKDRIVGLDTLSPILSVKLSEAALHGSAKEVIGRMEQALESEWAVASGDLQKMELIRRFMDETALTSVREFCDQNQVNIRTFERITVRYTGYTPNILRQIKRFQVVSNQLVHRQSNLTDLAYVNDYADQSHLIKEFRRFSGKAPGKFRTAKESVKENIRYDNS